MYKIAILLAILGISSSNGQLTSAGQCSFKSPVHYQDKANSADTGNQAYELKRIKNSWNTGHCATWNITVLNTDVQISRTEVANRKLVERKATAQLNEDGTLTLTFPDFTSKFTYIGQGDDYIVLYACSNQGSNKQEYAWVLGLTKTLSTSAQTAVEKILKDNKLDAASWEDISHTAESCKSGAVTSMKLSSIIVLIIGFVISKGL